MQGENDHWSQYKNRAKDVGGARAEPTKIKDTSNLRWKINENLKPEGIKAEGHLLSLVFSYF